MNAIRPSVGAAATVLHALGVGRVPDDSRPDPGNVLAALVLRLPQIGWFGWNYPADLEKDLPPHFGHSQ